MEYADTYERNHPGTTVFRADIRELSVKDIFRTTGLARNDVDVLIGGPPCQGFSINAPIRRKDDDRNQLFQHYGRLVLEGLHPKVILMENVPGMLSLDQGRFIDAIYRLFESAGYHMQHMVLSPRTTAFHKNAGAFSSSEPPSNATSRSPSQHTTLLSGRTSPADDI